MTAASQLTYSGVLIAVLANQLCLPIPSVVFLMAAGALSASGHMRTGIVILLSVCACLFADAVWFWFGRRWGSQAVRLLCRMSSDPRGCSLGAHQRFRRYGLRVLCVAKFLPGVDGVTPPLIGAEGIALPAFLAYDAVGSLLWSAFYVGLGYLFSRQVDIAIRWAEHFGTAVGVAIGVPIALYAGWRGLILVRMIRTLRFRRMSPQMLERKLRSGRKVAVLDLLSFEEEPETPEGIPGASRVDPARLRKSPRLLIPDDVEIVLYCSAGGELVSARAAVALNRIGVKKVWVLEGGLQAWRKQGFPVSECLEQPEIVAARVGVHLPKV